MKHRIVWFTALKDGAPVDGGSREEDSLTSWDYAEAYRLEFGVNLEAFVPIVDALGELNPEDLPDPRRAMEVISPARLETMRPETYKIKDRYGMPRAVNGQEVADWLASYRALWEQGYTVVRTAL